jgi:hypothetical protein
VEKNYLTVPTILVFLTPLAGGCRVFANIGDTDNPDKNAVTVDIRPAAMAHNPPVSEIF